MDDKTILYEEVDAATEFYDKPKTTKSVSSKGSSEKKVNKKTSSKKPKKKSKIGFEYDSPFTLTFSILCVLAFVLENYVIKNFFTEFDFALFSTATKQGTDFAFSATNFSHYIRLFTYVFGFVDWTQLFFTVSFCLLLGPNLEINYGSKLFFIMILISAFITGVLASCFSTISLMGGSSIVFMMIILSAYSAMEKKKLPLSLIFVFGIFLSQQLFVNIENFSTGLPVLLYFAGGFFGCVFGFLSTPLKKRKKAT